MYTVFFVIYGMQLVEEGQGTPRQHFLGLLETRPAEAACPLEKSEYLATRLELF